MEARIQRNARRRAQIPVNRNLAIEVSYEEILDDLLYPGRRHRAQRAAKTNGRAR